LAIARAVWLRYGASKLATLRPTFAFGSAFFAAA
jgi:hypothetical protein